MAKFDKEGREIPDKTPVELPVGYNPPEPLSDTIKRMIQNASDEAERSGNDTLEEGDDFDVEDGDEVDFSQYQMTDMQEEALADGRDHRPLQEERRDNVNNRSRSRDDQSSDDDGNDDGEGSDDIGESEDESPAPPRKSRKLGKAAKKKRTVRD